MAIALSACESDSSTQIADLTNSELSELCSENRHVWRATPETWCSVIQRAAYVGDDAGCAVATEECIASDLPDEWDVIWDDCEGERAGFPVDCRARVGLYQECMSYIRENLDVHLANDFTCDMPLPNINGWPTSCELFEDSCPGYLEEHYGGFFGTFE